MEQWEADIAVTYARDPKWTGNEAVLLAKSAIRNLRDEAHRLESLKGQQGRIRRMTRQREAHDLQRDWLLRL